MGAEVYPGRFTAHTDDEVILFRIGMRFNGWRGLMAALRTFVAMPSMLAEQHAQPEIGILWSTTALSWPVIGVTQFWRSFDDLERYAAAPDKHHAPAWRWFNKLGKSGRGTGIWHETYRIAPGSFEAIYVNMPRYGMAAATSHVPLVPAKARARARITESLAGTTTATSSCPVEHDAST